MTVTQRKVVVYDAAELNAIESFLHNRGQKQPTQGSNLNQSQSNKVGFMTIVTGKISGNDSSSTAPSRVVGVQVPQWEPTAASDVVQLDPNTHLDSDSIAYIPSSISDIDAITTYVSSLVAVHCTLPRVSHVGGNVNAPADDFVGGKVVVVGASDYAVFAAR